MLRRRIAVLSTVLAGLLIAAIPSFAAARSAYVTGFASEGGGGFAVPVDLAAAKAGEQVPIPTVEGAPRDVAITPDGTRAYVVTGTNAVVPIDVSTNKAGTAVPVGSGAESIAITPNGKAAYVTDGSNSVTPIDLASGTTGSAILVGSLPEGIAITPDGTRAYVANFSSNNLSVIDIATNTVVATIPVGPFPSAVAVTPNGSTVYVAESDGIVPIDVATNTAGTTIADTQDRTIAISPDGTRAYVIDGSGEVTPIDLGTASVGTTIAIGGFVSDLAFLPDGSRVYVPASGNLGQLVPIDVATNTLGTAFEVGEQPSAIAIVPNQPPHAAFSSSPAAAAPGASVVFDAKGSTDSDGTVARYDWDFGDGASAANAGAVPQHTYAKAGTFPVTLTTTDNEDCSIAFVFTGQTAYCNGSSVARVTHPVTVSNCPKVEGSASSFVPKLRSHHIVPGVRVRLAVNAPAHLEIESTLLWSKEGENGRASLSKVSVDVNRWRRIRIPIPGALRARLPLSTPVSVSLRIHATPRNGSACIGSVSRPTLRLRVVKVIPDAVQFKRAR